jgi:hypothetical protein
MTKATFVNFFTKVIKFYWLMLLLYPGELYRLLGASSYLGLSKNKNELMLLNPYPLMQKFLLRHIHIYLFLRQKRGIMKVTIYKVFTYVHCLYCKNVQHVKIYKKCSTVKNVRQLCGELFLLKCIFLLNHCFWLLK